jgi:MFS family permease
MRSLSYLWRLPYPWLLVVTLGCTETISWGILFYGFAVYMPVMEAEFGWGRGAMAAAFGAATIIAGLCAIPVGWWIDRFGARVPMTIGSILASGVIAAWSQVRSFEQFALLWVVAGVAMAMVLYEPAFAVVTSWFDEQRGRALTAVTLMAGFASTIFMPTESLLIEALGWRQSLSVLSAFLALTTILPHLLIVGKPPPRVSSRGQRSDSPPSLAESYAIIRRSPDLQRFAVAMSISSFVSVGLSVHLPSYLGGDLGLNAQLAATLTGMVGAMQVVGRVLMQFAGERVFARGGVAVVLGLQPAAILLLLVPITAGVLLSIGLFGAARGVFTLIRPILIGRILGSHGFATVSALLTFLVVLANALGPAAIGWARDLAGDYRITLWGLVGLSTVAALIAVPIRGRKSQPS